MTNATVITPTYEELERLLQENYILLNDLIANIPENMKKTPTVMIDVRNANRAIDSASRDLRDVHFLIDRFQSRLNAATNENDKEQIKTLLQSAFDHLRQIHVQMYRNRNELKQLMQRLEIPLVPQYDEDEHFIELFKEVQHWLVNYPGKPPTWIKRKWNEFVKTYGLGSPHPVFPNLESLRKATRELEEMRKEFMELPQYQSTPDGSPPLYASQDDIHVPGSELTLTESIVPSPKGEKKSFWSKWFSGGRNSSSPLAVTNAFNIAQRQQRIPGLQPAWTTMTK